MSASSSKKWTMTLITLWQLITKIVIFFFYDNRFCWFMKHRKAVSREFSTLKRMMLVKKKIIHAPVHLSHGSRLISELLAMWPQLVRYVRKYIKCLGIYLHDYAKSFEIKILLVSCSFLDCDYCQCIRRPSI